MVVASIGGWDYIAVRYKSSDFHKFVPIVTF